MKKWLVGLLSVVASGVFAVTPGKVVKMVPQSGISKSFDVTTENGILIRVQFYTPEIFRILAAQQKMVPMLDRGGNPMKDKEGKEKLVATADFSDPLNDPAKAQILTDAAKEDKSRVTFADNRKDGTYTFSTPALTLTLKKADCTFSLTSDRGERIFTEVAPLDLTKDGTTQTLQTYMEEFFYGGGQQNGVLSHKGRKIEIVADGNWEEGGHPNPAPWYMTNTGYGVLRHTFATGEYDFSDASKITTKHNENRFDAFYFVGGNFNRNLELYTLFTGRPNFIPMWGLEMGDADAYMTRDEVTKEPKQKDDGSYKELTPDAIKIAEKYRAADMPGGWLLVNDGYGCGHMQLGYTVDGLWALGFRTGLWTEGSLDLINWEVANAGTRVQKIDVAWSGPAYQHALQCNKTAAEGIENNSDARAFVWTVQGWAGTQRYGICWTGDQYGSWDLIRYHIPTVTCSGMSGQAYATTDVDGIFGGSPETYVRDLQWKCWTPAMYVMNGWSHINKGPWSYEEPYKSHIRHALKHKMRMTPFIYAYMRNAWENGEPIVRPLVWNYPEDRTTWDDATKYEYMLGNELLIAPVYNSMKLNKGWKKDIYLPDELWVDYNDGRRIEGPAKIAAYPIDLGKLPVFVKAGSILPMYPEMLSMGEKAPDPLTFDVYPYGLTSFTVYEDDGETRAYQAGEFSRQSIVCSAPLQEGSDDVVLTLMPAEGAFDGMLERRVYAFDVHLRTCPLTVMLNGEEILKVTDPVLFANSRQSWYYDEADRYGVLHVKLHRRSVRDSAELIVRVDPAAKILPTAPYPVPAITDELDKADFIVSVNSQQNNSSIKNAFDGTDDTLWHSTYSKDSTTQATNFPYIIDIDIRQLAAMNGLVYLPRQDLGNGVVKDYEIQIARTPGHYATVATGSFKPFVKDAKGKVAPAKVMFPTTWGRSLRFILKSEQKGQRFGSAAEIDILQDSTAKPLPDETLPIGKETLTVDGQKFPNCIKSNVGFEKTIELDGTWEKILGHAGMESGNKNVGTVTFRIFADGRQIFERLGMNGTQVKQLINVDIPSNAKQLKFTLTPQSDDCAADHTGVWTDLRFFRAGSAK
ncbi:MAG: glycoside hydrolase family 31 protein [Kiritimatiellia bacterium]